MSTGETVERMRDHWWWRPGWRIGRSFYTWHITFGDQPAIDQLADGYAPALDGLPTLGPDSAAMAAPDHAGRRLHRRSQP
jgi:hypothetical protein